MKNNKFNNFRAELKKVIWPTPKQLFNNTVAVISIVIITAVVVAVLDLGFGLLNEYGINKIREAVVSDETEIVTTNNFENENIDEKNSNSVNNESIQDTENINEESNKIENDENIISNNETITDTSTDEVENSAVGE